MSLKVTVLERSASRDRSGVRGLGPWLQRIAPAKARGDVTVVVVPDTAVRRLNKQFRGKDMATDVLSFPGGSQRGPGRFLGEIVIARGIARRQARLLGHGVGTEVRILALHGLLHLLGYDHEVDNGRMARVEARLRKRAGLPEGLISRSS